MSYYRGRATGSNSPSGAGGPPKRLLPEQLHDVFGIEINRLNDNGQIIEEDGLLFDSNIEQERGDNNNNNKYRLSSVYIGEIFRFRIKISNKYMSCLYNFGVLCHIEMNLKGNGSPTQLYPKQHELCPTVINKKESISINLEYPVTANEPSSYSLILSITASTDDNAQQLYKNIFEFHSVPCLSLTYQKQTLDENLFVEVLINNVSNQPKLPLYVHVNFKCLGLFKSYNLTHHNKQYMIQQTNNDDIDENDSVFLNPQQEETVLFQIEMKNPTSLVNLNALSVGQIEIKWKSFNNDKKTNIFRQGIFLSDIIQRRSLFCRKLAQQTEINNNSNNNNKTATDNIEILILKCPSSCIVHKAFIVTFHIFNLDRYSHKIWLSIDKNTSGYLLPCNISTKYLGVLETSSSIKTEMKLIAFAPGIHVLTGIVIQTQRLYPTKIIDDADNNNNNKEAIIKTIHYESTQYVYIDIDPEFHIKKLKEKQEREEKKQLFENINLLAMKDNNDNDETTKSIEQQMKHRESMELDKNQENEFKLEPSPKHKPMIPSSSDLKPIGHQKSDDEILKEVQEERKQEMASLQPLKSMDNEEEEEEEEEKKEEKKEEENKEEEQEEGEQNNDVLDVPPLEVEQQENEQELDKKMIKIRDLGASDADQSAISVAIVTEKNENIDDEDTNSIHERDETKDDNDNDNNDNDNNDNNDNNDDIVNNVVHDTAGNDD